MPAVYDQRQIYLMGRLMGRDGEPTSRYFPLPYETLSAPGLKFETKVSVEPQSKKSVTEVSAKFPIAVSDKNGVLNVLSENIDTGELVRNPVTQSSVQHAKGKKSLQQVLFFPSYLVPMVQLSLDSESPKTGWLKKLYEYLKESAEDKVKECCVDMKAVEINVKNQCLELPENEELLKTKYFENYSDWLTTHIERKILAVEVPQFYTIQIVFSSKDYENATVTLSDLSSQIVTHNKNQVADIVGNQTNNDKGHPVSIVKEVEYSYFDTDGNKLSGYSYVATFWIQSPKVLTLSEVDKFSKIDVSFEKLDIDAQRTLINKGIPPKYSLKENLFMLPIHTLTGRCTLINGDPISVEEALLNHAPQFYPHVMETMAKQPFDLPETLVMNNTVGASLPQQTWSVIQNSKGILETSFGALEKGVSWVTIGKVVGAATSQATGITDTVGRMVGLSLASVGFMKTLSELNEIYDNKLTRAGKTAFGALSTAVVFGERASPHVRASMSLADLYSNANLDRFTRQSFEPFVRGVGKFGSFILEKADPVITIADTVHGWGSYGQANSESSKKDNKLIGNISRYMMVTSSLHESKLKAFQQDKSVAEKYQQAIKALQSILANEFVPGKGHFTIDEKTAIGALLRLDATIFNFNKSELIAGEGPYEAIARQLESMADAPFEIVITGHTCIIGSEDVNMRLSAKRAVAVKNAILNGFRDDSVRKIWEPNFKLVAEGFQRPLPGNLNRTEEERKKNRRVEIFFNISTSVQYPPSRAGLYEVEKSAKQKILANIGANDALITAINSTIDSALMGVSAIFPPAKAIVAGKAAMELAKQAIQFINKTFQEEKHKLLDDINTIRYQDLMAINTFLSHSDTQGIDNVHLRAYMKRMTALNGLMRLLRTYQLAQLDKPSRSANLSHTYSAVNSVSYTPKAKSFADFDILGYIDAFILNDDWELDVSLQGTENLDEVWLNKNGFENNTTNIFDGNFVSMNFASATAVVRRYTSGEQTDLIRAQASNYSKYFPIHYRASEDDKHFKNLLTDTIPQGLDESIFKKVAVFVRRPYKDGAGKSPKQDDWVPFDKYYKDNQNQITPYDNIKVVAIINEEKAKVINGSVRHFMPINLVVHSQGSNEGAWHFFDSEASSHTEYVRNLSRGEFSPEEVNVLFSGDDSKQQSLFGVTIQPSYFFGVRRIFGIRPIADYDSAVMKGLFDSKSKAIPSGAMQFLSYSMSLCVPGQSNTEKDIDLVVLSNQKYTPRFNMTLCPTRSYEFTKDFKNFSPPQFADGLFYEESFLEPPVKGKELSYPKVFDSAETLFYLQQTGCHIDKPLDAAIAKDPLVSNTGRLRGKIRNFDWDADVTATLVIKTKPNDAQKLIDQKYDPNEIPVDIKLVDKDRWYGKNDRPLTNINTVIRVGNIIKTSDGYEFKSARVNPKLKHKALANLVKDFKSFDSAQLKAFCLTGEKNTELFANVSELSFINFFGHEVKGLVPMLQPSKAYNVYGQAGVKFTAYVNGPHKSGLDGSESNFIHIYDAEVKKVPLRWYQLKDKQYEIDIAKRLNESRTDAELYENKDGKPIKFLPHQNLKRWMEVSDNFDTLVQKRIDMLGDWVD
ncbi:OmpA family protein [Vibrio proteolyticus]